MGRALWPLFDIRVRTPRIELRPADQEDVFTLAELVVEGIHEPDDMPFSTPWSTLPRPQLERGVLQWHWKSWATWSPGSWNLLFAVVVDGEVVGTQGIDADDFAVRRAVTTGSWLVRRRQGQGLGKEMRAAVLHFAFAGLGAEVALSGAYPDNGASIAVSRAMGYEEDGCDVMNRSGRAARSHRFRLERAAWEERRRPDIAVTGLEPCLDLFGASGTG